VATQRCHVDIALGHEAKHFGNPVTFLLGFLLLANVGLFLLGTCKTYLCFSCDVNFNLTMVMLAMFSPFDMSL